LNTIRKNCGMRKAVVPVLCILGFILMMSAVDTFAGPPTFLTLRGTYYVVGSHSCVNSADGFSDDGSFSLLSAGSMRTAHYEGFLNLYFDGTGKYTVNETQYIFQNIQQGSFPMGYQNINCDVTYGKADNGLFDITFSNCEGINVLGIGIIPTPNVTEYAPKTLSMAATRDGEVLVLSNTFPEVESFTRNVTPIKRLCSRTFTAIRQSFE